MDKENIMNVINSDSNIEDLTNFVVENQEWPDLEKPYNCNICTKKNIKFISFKLVVISFFQYFKNKSSIFWL